MKQNLTLLIASTALTAAAALAAPVHSATVLMPGYAEPAGLSMSDGSDPRSVTLVSDHDEGGDSEHNGRASSGESDDDECDDDEGQVCRAGAGSPAPAGTVAPPQNGLFAPGAAPQVQTN